MVHLSSDTDSHWEVKLVGLGKSDGRPSAQVVSIGQLKKSSQHHTLPTINWAYAKYVLSLHFKTRIILICLTVFEW
jgi:hypothetical protein